MENRKMVSCHSCGKEWSIKEEEYSELKVCPFCVSEYRFPEEVIVIDSFPKAILKVISSFGINVLNERSRFLSCLLDFAPDYKKEVKIVSRVCTQSVFSEMVKWASISKSEQSASIAKLKAVLIEEEALSEEWAERIIDSFSVAIIPTKQQQKKLPETTTPAQPKVAIENKSDSKTIREEPIKIGTDDVFLLFVDPTDPKGVMAKKYLNDAGIIPKTIDAKRYSSIAEHYSVHQTPTLIVFRNGKIEKRPQGIDNIQNYLKGMRKTETPVKTISPAPSVQSSASSEQYTETVTGLSINTALAIKSLHVLVWDKRTKIPHSGTFKGNKDIEFVIINGRKVESNLFENCQNLKAVYIGSCSEIGSNAFNNCKSLTHVIIGGKSNPSIGSFAFDCCPNAVFYYDTTNSYGKQVCERMARTPKQVSSYNAYSLKERYLWSRSDYNKYSTIAAIIEYVRKRLNWN